MIGSPWTLVRDGRPDAAVAVTVVHTLDPQDVRHLHVTLDDEILPDPKVTYHGWWDCTDTQIDAALHDEVALPVGWYDRDNTVGPMTDRDANAYLLHTLTQTHGGNLRPTRRSTRQRGGGRDD